jgi:hypothetical protein
MTKPVSKNVAESVRQRLLNLAKKQKTEFTHVLIRYAIERILYRLSISRHADRFMLKGAMLLSLWSEQPYRPTLDVDFLAQGDSSEGALQQAWREVMEIDCAEDGLEFLPSSLHTETIKEGQQYEGLRVTLKCRLAQAILPVQIDIAFGDAVTPGPLKLTYPTLLQLPPPVLLTYPRETVAAEKLEAMVKLGIANSRMKDFADLDFLANHFEFDGNLLSTAITATFARRKTTIGPLTPMSLTPEFYENADKQKQWRAFVRKGKLADPVPELKSICERLTRFLLPPYEAARNQASFRMWWTPHEGWLPIDISTHTTG